MLGVNPEAEREENDFYATDPYAVRIALPVFKRIGLNKKVWECACGNGNLSEELKSNGYSVYSSDLINRNYGEVSDFLKVTDRFNGDILTNPPFSLAEKFIEHGMTLLNEGNRMFLLLKIQFLESAKRKKIFQKYNLEYLIVNSERICCAKDNEFDKYFKRKNDHYAGGTQFYAWFVFKKGYNGDSKIIWI